jgi:mono/diheme cytochrome c family protein
LEENTRDRMKKITLITFSVFLIVAACRVQKYIEPEFPEAMLPHVKIEYTTRYEKGQILYNMNCARCHTTKVGRKLVVPDFKPEQLRGYELRVVNAQHEKNMPDSLVTEEELGIIMTFLTYKKKNTNS